MQIGNFLIEQLSEGFFELFKDGSFQKMNPARLENSAEEASLGNYSSAIGIDPLLLSGHKNNIVVDPGLGWGLDVNSRYADTSNIKTNLDIFDISPEQVDLVILTHLHFDHAAGSTFVSNDFKTTPTFPNARYLVHRQEWEFALTQIEKENQHTGADYRLDELYKLAADDRFQFIERDVYSPLDGITLLKTAGHTPGHLVVKISGGNEKAYFLGDLIPTEYHLNHYAMKRADTDPVQSKKIKTRLLTEACNEQAVLFFYHSLYRKSGKLSKDSHKKYMLLDL